MQYVLSETIYQSSLKPSLVAIMAPRFLIATPSILGLTQVAALSLLQAGSLAGVLTGFAYSSFPVNTVCSQSPVAGTLVSTGSAVSYQLSLGLNTGFRVMAVTAGMYAGRYRAPGDVFDLARGTDFSDSSVNYQINSGGSIGYGWMQRVADSVAPYEAETAQYAPIFPADDPLRRTVM